MVISPFLIQLMLILLKVICLLVVIAYYTIAERKIMASIQRRRGPNVVGFWGLLQPVADGLKLVAKEIVIPSHSNSRIFVLAPMVILTLGLVSWSILPFGCFDYSEVATRYEMLSVLYNFEPKFANSGDFFKKGPLLTMQTIALCYITHTACTYPNARFEKSSTIPQENEVFNLLLETNHISDIRYSLLIILAISSLSVYALIIAGWSSNSKYAFLGALRSAAQMISYEVSISLVILPVIFLAGSLNFTEIVISQRLTILYIFPLLPLAIIFFIASLAETNRTPFDLPEAEAELVAGYNIEYSSIIFAMFFLGEYGNITLMSVINSDIFFGGWAGSLFDSLSAFVVSVKAVIIAASFVLVRATFPRYRYDQLINIGWKIFLPVATGLMVSAVGVVITFAALPVVHELFIY